MDWVRRAQRPLLATLAIACGIGAAPVPAPAFTWPGSTDGPWPDSRDLPVATLDHPTVEEVFRVREERGQSAEPYRFVAFGDQRALADEDWPELMRRIADWDREEEDLAFLIDTGDIVNDGSHSDQFAWLAREILSITPDLPYLVGIGNHEVSSNDDPAARASTAKFLAYLDDRLSPDRLFYRKDLGAATFLFLDTNDLVYGPDGDRDACPAEVDPGGREGRQMAWLREQLADTAAREPRLVIAVLHHPPVQSSKIHRKAAASIWNVRDGGHRLVDLLADGGVDVILTGHTHTYERFRLVRDDGRRIDVVNVSGRPRDAFLWYGDGRRRRHRLLRRRGVGRDRSVDDPAGGGHGAPPRGEPVRGLHRSARRRPHARNAVPRRRAAGGNTRAPAREAALSRRDAPVAPTPAPGLS